MSSKFISKMSTFPPDFCGGLVAGLAGSFALTGGPTTGFFSGGLTSFIDKLLKDFFSVSGFFY